MLRWLITLLLSTALAASLVLLQDARNEYSASIRQQENLERKLNRMRSVERSLQEQAQKIDEWNRLWDRVQEENVAPKNWFVNQINTRREMDWEQLEELLLFVSNGHPRTTGYWFLPRTMSVDRKTEQTDQGREDEAGAEEAKDTFNIRLSGMFLIPKL
jgi:hypothetical protein